MQYFDYYIVVCRTITMQQLRDKQIYQSYCWVTVKKTCLHSNAATHNNKDTVGNSIFYGGPCRGVISWTKWRLCRKGATIQRVIDHRSRGIAIVAAITRQLLVKALQAGLCLLIPSNKWRNLILWGLAYSDRLCRPVDSKKYFWIFLDLLGWWNRWS
jgi:hypothetical protein